MQMNTISEKDFITKKEILTFDIKITGSKVLKEGKESQYAVSFNGSCDCLLFKGHILPGAQDIQDYLDGKPIKFCATYTLEGTDYTGTPCQLHIINTNIDDQWKPTIQTDSKALAALNHSDLTAKLDFGVDALTVHIFADCNIPL